MEMKTIDTRGLSCPQPVVLVQKAIKAGYRYLKIQADLVVAKENIIRCASNNHLDCTVNEEGNEFVITLSE